MILTAAQEGRLWAKVAAAPNGCVQWTGATLRGYGQLNVDGVPRYVHRLAYELAYGEIPDGLQIDHLCRNAGCLNHLHLEAVTQAENLRRSAEALGIRQAATHCPSNHPYDGLNTMVDRNGWRKCRECNRRRCADSYRKRNSSTR